MRAKVKRFSSPDIDLDSFAPERPEQVGFLLQMFVGPEDKVGEESFDVMVCTPEWLRANYSDRVLVPLQNHVLIFNYDRKAIFEQLSLLRIQRCVGDTWNDVARQVARIGKWEFE